MRFGGSRLEARRPVHPVHGQIEGGERSEEAQCRRGRQRSQVHALILRGVFGLFPNILEAHPSAFPQALPGLLNAPEEPWIVFKLPIEPVFLFDFNESYLLHEGFLGSIPGGP